MSHNEQDIRKKIEAKADEMGYSLTRAQVGYIWNDIRREAMRRAFGQQKPMALGSEIRRGIKWYGKKISK